MKKVYISDNPADAHMAKSVLESGGIEVVIQGEALWGARGELPVSSDTSPSVWTVNDSDYEEALKVISTLMQGNNLRAAEGEEWRCEGCEEVNETPFTECWQCGRDRPL
jgi:hypothetical protein